MASKYEDQENKPPSEIVLLRERQEERRRKQEKRAKRALRKQWKEAARNVRGMRSYGGYSMGPRLRRSFKEIKNKRFIQQRQGELQLIMKNEELERKIKSYENFLKSNGILSLLDDGILNDEGERSMKKLLFNAQRRRKVLRESERLGTLKNLIDESDNRAAGDLEKYKTPQKRK